MEQTQSGQQTQSEVADGMRIDWDVAIPMDDGVVLRADVFRPLAEGRYPVIMTLGPYGKGLAFQDKFYKGSWDNMVGKYPEIAEGSSNKYQNWEVVDPEKWVPDGYICIRVDSRGAGHSPGVMEVWSPRERKDYHDCIEWAAAQPWSNGKVGLNGISYYAMNQWYVASLQPPHLAAICVWEGAADYYRDLSRHGGILSTFLSTWFNRTLVGRQYGYGERGARSWVTGELVAGPETLPDDVLAKNRIDPGPEVLKRPLDGDVLSRALAAVRQDYCAAAVGGELGRHRPASARQFRRLSRGRLQAEVAAGARQFAFLAVLSRRTARRCRSASSAISSRARTPAGTSSRRFSFRFAIPARNSWCGTSRNGRWRARSGPSSISIPQAARLNREPNSGAAVEYETTGDGVSFALPAQARALEITGPVAAKLFVSSDTTDADLFLALRLFDPNGKEVLFVGSNDPCVPIGLGWLRASQRKLDAKRSLPYRPYHPHDESWPLTPGEPVELDIEILPTSIVVPPGYRFVLNVRGKDFDHGLGDRGFANALYPMRGTGNLLHDDPQDRPAAIFGGRNRLHFAAGKEPYLLLPIIPSQCA